MTNGTMHRALTSGRYCERPAPDSGVSGCDSRGRHYGANAPDRHGGTVQQQGPRSQGDNPMSIQRKTITLQVEVQFDGDETDLVTVESDLAWSLHDQFGVDNEWNAGRDDKLVVLHTKGVLS